MPEKTGKGRQEGMHARVQHTIPMIPARAPGERNDHKDVIARDVRQGTRIQNTGMRIHSTGRGAASINLCPSAHLSYSEFWSFLVRPGNGRMQPSA